MEESVFDIQEYEKFLEENAASIEAFETKRKRAFEEEKERWIANGQLTFESHTSKAPRPRGGRVETR